MSDQTLSSSQTTPIRVTALKSTLNTDDKIIEIKQELASKLGALTHIKREIDDRSLAITDYEKDSPIFESNMRHIEKLANERAQLEIEMAELQEKVVDPTKVKLSKDDFLNVVKTAADKMRAGSAVEKDTLCRILFLNLRVDNEKVASYHWNEPFASLVKATEINFGADERT